MHRAVVLVLLAACGRIGFDVTSDSPVGTLDDGLVAFYPMEDNTVGARILDATGHGLDGLCSTGMSCFARTAGVNGSAIEVTGPGTLLVADSPRLHLDSGFTVSVWLARRGGTSPLSKTQASGDGASFELVTFTTGYAFCTDANLAGDSSSCLGAEAPPIDPWMHVTMTYDGARKRLYVNGAEIATELANTAFDGAPMSIGSDYKDGAVSSQFDGGLDLLRIYDRALTAAEIQELFSQRL